MLLMIPPSLYLLEPSSTQNRKQMGEITMNNHTKAKSCFSLMPEHFIVIFKLLLLNRYTLIELFRRLFYSWKTEKLTFYEIFL